MAPPTKRRFCPHCQEHVSVRTFREHFDLYLNKEKDEWQKIESSDEEDSLHDEVRRDLLDRIPVATDDHDGDNYHSETDDESAPGSYACFLDILDGKIFRTVPYINLL